MRSHPKKWSGRGKENIFNDKEMFDVNFLNVPLFLVPCSGMVRKRIEEFFDIN